MSLMQNLKKPSKAPRTIQVDQNNFGPFRDLELAKGWTPDDFRKLADDLEDADVDMLHIAIGYDGDCYLTFEVTETEEQAAERYEKELEKYEKKVASKKAKTEARIKKLKAELAKLENGE